MSWLPHNDFGFSKPSLDCVREHDCPCAQLLEHGRLKVSLSLRHKSEIIRRAIVADVPDESNQRRVTATTAVQWFTEAGFAESLLPSFVLEDCCKEQR